MWSPNVLVADPIVVFRGENDVYDFSRVFVSGYVKGYLSEGSFTPSRPRRPPTPPEWTFFFLELVD